MTSQAQAQAPMDGVRGLVFIGFPLHPAGKPSQERAAHLNKVNCPMLFLQGTRDEFAELSLLKPVVKKLGKLASLHVIEGGDHSLKVPKSSGVTQEQLFQSTMDEIVRWLRLKLS